MIPLIVLAVHGDGHVVVAVVVVCRPSDDNATGVVFAMGDMDIQCNGIMMLVDEREHDLLIITGIVRAPAFVDKIECELFLSYFNLPPFL